MRYLICTIAAALAAAWALPFVAAAQQGGSTQQAAPDPASNPDQELGRKFLIRPENLALPKSGPVAASRSLVIPYAGQTPRVMEGFTVTPFVIGLEQPRRLLVRYLSPIDYERRHAANPDAHQPAAVLAAVKDEPCGRPPR